MIVTAIDESWPLFRAHTPRWSSQPLSGAGAALHGGRLNRPGVHALYLALGQATAIAEYQQDEMLMPPCMLVAYRARIASVVDFRAGYAPGVWHPLWQDIDCNWRSLAFLEEIDPPTWDLCDQVLAAGHSGILFPSQKSEGVNLVLYLDALRPDDRIEVIDPRGDLPRDQASWPAR
ncbi:RES family NAD+ phosphorylase [Tahibacter soli]|uniref:RES family NAD+ phosphorylase n=1 Tax=Tahibacter soli TaxID=2983605 RepID=A0A9X3YLV1_9GAMM|nr:RES family NAD+ phosphorylase [Tahibacter soli]MDC8013645.1 RES family NAD+ phosphorylase [Tahibacter soli]